MQRNGKHQKLQVTGVLAVCGLVTAAGSLRLFAAPPGKPAPAVAGSEANDSKPLTEGEKIVHVLNRLGFGPRPGDIEKVRAVGLDRYIDQQLHPEQIDDNAVDRQLAGFKMLSLSGDELAQMYYDRNAAAKQAQAIQREVLKGMPAIGSGTAAGDTMAAPQTPMAGQPGMPPQMPQMTADGGNDAASGKGKYAAEMANATPEEQNQMRQARTDLVAKQSQLVRTNVQLMTAKSLRAVESQRQLQEVLVDFWGNHFNIDTRKGPCATLKVVDDRDVIRPYALSKFRDLLGASAKSPAMLFYLDNFQSTSPQALPQRRRFAAQAKAAVPARPRPGGLNENYGREVMELHTLGVDGGYTQKDVTEVARCFTGWGLKRIANTDPATAGQRRYGIGGAFEFHPYLHDNGEKTVLGHRIPAGGGIQDGEMVLDVLASAPATMQHVSFELCQRFVADKPPASLVDKCVATWRKTDGDIREVVRTIVTSPEFYSRAAYRQKLKSPFEYAISAVRALGGNYDFSSMAQQAYRANGRQNPYNGIGANTLIGQVSTMGEPIFEYQAPTGYPEDSHKWRSTGALISRLNFSLALSYGKLSEVRFPDVDEEVTGLSGTNQIVNRLANNILHGDLSPSTREVILREAEQEKTASALSSVSAASDLDLLRRTTALMLGSPEFQRR